LASSLSSPVTAHNDPLPPEPVIALFARQYAQLGECVGVGDGQRGLQENGARQIDLIAAPWTASQPAGRAYRLGRIRIAGSWRPSPGGALPDVDIPFGRRREQDCQAQRRLWGQVQISPASVVAELDAVAGVALEAADDDDAISLAVLGTLVC
jgi:hypothetical protein